MSNIQNIPLNQLKPSRWNVRKTGGKDVADLAASIKSVGLLQNLTVNAGDDGVFYVVNGGRRLAALLDLWRAGHVVADHPVPCNVIDPADTDLVEASLAENVIREAMHPADQFEAFKALVGEGMPVADVAARFGVSEHVVKQRLKLANVSPVLMAEYREGNATLEQLQALAITDDHAAQEQVWEARRGSWQAQPSQLRKALTEAEIPSDDPRVRFVGLDAYEAEGGFVRRDLFSDAAYIDDAKLLDTLVAGKLAEVANQVQAEGWAWVDTHLSMDWEQRNAYRTAAQPSMRKFTAEEQAEYDSLESRLDAINEQAEDAEGDEYQALVTEGDTIQEQLDQMDEARKYWPDATKAKTGVLICLRNGELEIVRGVLRPGEKLKADGSVDVSGHTRAAPGKAAKQAADLPQKSVERLWGERTAILRGNISDRVALAALAAELAADVLSLGSSTPVKIGKDHEYIPPPMQEGLRSHPDNDAMEEHAEGWVKRLSKGKGNLFAWLLEQPERTTLELLAFCSAASIVAKDDGAKFAEAAAVDVARHWEVTAEWLSAQPKAYILAALREIKVKTDGMDKLKVADLAAKAAPLLKAKDWLPAPFREPKAKKADHKRAAANDRDDDE